MTTTHNTGPSELHPSLLAELAQAGTHLGHGALAARSLNALALAESIASVELQTNDLMRRQLRGLRLAASLSQAELARLVGSRPGTISEFETGKRAIVPEFVLRVSAALGLTSEPSASTGALASVVLEARTGAARG